VAKVVVVVDLTSVVDNLVVVISIIVSFNVVIVVIIVIIITIIVTLILVQQIFICVIDPISVVRRNNVGIVYRIALRELL
jgi:hypothetical protein